jgi:dihydroorotate dehydrogenase subfamily 2
MRKRRDIILIFLLILAAAGIIDSAYLTYEHFAVDSSVTCGFGIFNECGRVLQSVYSVVYGIPLALFGFIYYSTLFAALTAITLKDSKLVKFLLLILTPIGVLTSLYLVYLQFFILNALCLYCMLSAIISLTLFGLIQNKFPGERVAIIARLSRFLYINLFSKIIFLFQSDYIHEIMVSFGQFLGNFAWLSKTAEFLFVFKSGELNQSIAGIKFANPVGLAAGYDYDARLTQILPAFGFGFQSVGTITNKPYEGNPPPRLGRLPKSRSLMVNKGFKNSGAKVVIKKMEKFIFSYPVGISIGRTNSDENDTQKESVSDIISAFKIFEKSTVKHTYYELNISCPNLKGNVTFYPPKNLGQLLSAVDKLKIKKQIFVKMPIEKSDRDALAMLKVIAKHKITGVIFGNLQKDRNNKVLVRSEVKKYKVGNFSGKPTYERSNELISLCYKHYKGRLVIIGCGGIFNGADAYEKFKRGASLVQFITGMIYEGPQVAANINIELADLLKKDGFKNISEVVGTVKH